MLALGAGIAMMKHVGIIIGEVETREIKREGLRERTPHEGSKK